MTTREELADGFRMILREGLRTTATFGPEDWQATVHDEENGWNVKQVYCHLAAVAEITPGFIGSLAQQGEGEDAAAGFDVDEFNAQAVAAKEKLSEPELVEAFKTLHEKLIQFIEELPEEQLTRQIRFGAVAGPAADVMETILVLHGLSHVYHAADRPQG